MKKPDSLKVIFTFSKTGYLKAILLGGDSEEDQKTLEKALDRVLNPPGWMRRLFQRLG